MEELIGKVIDIYIGDSNLGIINAVDDHIDEIADYMFEHTEDYDFMRDVFYWTDGSIGITYLSTDGSIKNYIVFKGDLNG